MIRRNIIVTNVRTEGGRMNKKICSSCGNGMPENRVNDVCVHCEKEQYEYYTITHPEKAEKAQYTRSFTKNDMEFVVDRKITIYYDYVPKDVGLLSFGEGRKTSNDFHTLCTNFFKTHTHHIKNNQYYIDDVTILFNDGRYINNLNLLFELTIDKHHEDRDIRFAHNIEKLLIAGCLIPLEQRIMVKNTKDNS